VCAQGLAELADYEELVSRLEQGRISGTDAAMAGRWAALKARTEHVERLQVSTVRQFDFGNSMCAFCVPKSHPTSRGSPDVCSSTVEDAERRKAGLYAVTRSIPMPATRPGRSLSNMGWLRYLCTELSSVAGWELNGAASTPAP
jgi:hypothetical protein